MWWCRLSPLLGSPLLASSVPAAAEKWVFVCPPTPTSRLCSAVWMTPWMVESGLGFVEHVLACALQVSLWALQIAFTW